MIRTDFDGWRRERLPGGGFVYRLSRDGYAIASTFATRSGWIASGPRVPHVAPFQSRQEAQAFCEREA